MNKPRVLVFVDYYLPGYKAGGPIASVSRMVKNLRSEYEIFVFTRDRDLGDSHRYPGVTPNVWTAIEGVKVFYADPNHLSTRSLAQVIAPLSPDLIYLNSYFSVLSRRILALHKARRIRNVKLAIAPRGEFSLGALNLKKLRKAIYLKAATATMLNSNVVWHVSSVLEREDVLRAVGSNCKTIIEAPDLLDLEDQFDEGIQIQKEPGKASFAWLSRISRKKNLDGAIQMLNLLHGTVDFHIYGPAEDPAYWAQCQDAINQLNSSVQVHVHGGIAPNDVRLRLAQHHFFLFPTHGENFGHVIPEAMAAGCLVLISDQTPWQDLEAKNAGWVIPLEAGQSWRNHLQMCIDLPNQRYQLLRKSVKQYVEEHAQNQHANGNSLLFETALSL